MNVKRLVIAIVVIYFVAYVIATLYSDVIFKDQYAAFKALTRPDVQSAGYMTAMLLGYLVMTSLFCFIFTKGYENKGLPEGLRYGLLMGILLATADWYYGILLPVSMTLVLLNTILDIIIWTVAGLILAAIYKPKPV